MVAVINTGRSLRRSVLYNENKLDAGAARLLSAENMPVSGSSDIRLKVLLKVAGLRPDVGVNSVHISLNFAPDEVLSDAKMAAIARDYMEGIGFGDQPYLVYRHTDSGHPHCHLVTTNVTMDGKRISLHHIGRLQSEPVRKELERKYGLIPADTAKKLLDDPLKPVDALKVQYGKTDSKRAIEKVLNKVLGQYKFCSLHELNAVLGLYNVRADRGEKGSRIYEKGGLVYRIIDGTGKAVGVPIKASLFYNKPGLKYLDALCLKNKSNPERIKDMGRIKSIIDFEMASKVPKSLGALKELLRKQGIALVLRQSEQGQLYGITYVHFASKSVFNGSSLGKDYSAKWVLERLGMVVEKPVLSLQLGTVPEVGLAAGFAPDLHSGAVPFAAGKSLWELLTQYEYTEQAVPNEWKKKRRRRKL